MRDIFQRATRVVAFLGMDVYARVAAKLIFEKAELLSCGDEDSSWNSFGHQDSPIWRAFGWLVTSPYFERCWIMQEVAVARDVQLLLGGLYVPWQTFYQVAKFAVLPGGQKTVQDPTRDKHSAGLNKGSLGNINILNDLRADSSYFNTNTTFTQRRTLESLLFDTQSFQSSDPRDKILALLGLASDYKDCDLLRPDYRKTTAQVFGNVARYMLLCRDPPCINLLALAGVGFGKRLGSLPSWVADWSESRCCPSFCWSSVLDAREGRSFKASKGTSPNIAHATNAEGIRVKGIVVDRVSSISSAGALMFGFETNGSIPHLDAVRKQMSFVDRACELIRAEFVADKRKASTLLDGLWSALIADRIVRNHPVPQAYKPLFESWLRWYRITATAADSAAMMSMIEDRIHRGIGPLVGIPWEDSEGHSVLLYNLSMVDACHGRSFGITRRGRLCLVPPLTKTGDEVFIAYGATTPLIVRQDRENDGNKRFTLIGEAFVQGVMFGESAGAAEREVVIELW